MRMLGSGQLLSQGDLHSGQNHVMAAKTKREDPRDQIQDTPPQEHGEPQNALPGDQNMSPDEVLEENKRLAVLKLYNEGRFKFAVRGRPSRDLLLQAFMEIFEPFIPLRRIDVDIMTYRAKLRESVETDQLKDDISVASSNVSHGNDFCATDDTLKTEEESGEQNSEQIEGDAEGKTHMLGSPCGQGFDPSDRENKADPVSRDRQCSTDNNCSTSKTSIKLKISRQNSSCQNVSDHESKEVGEDIKVSGTHAKSSADTVRGLIAEVIDEKTKCGGNRKKSSSSSSSKNQFQILGSRHIGDAKLVLERTKKILSESNQSKRSFRKSKPFKRNKGPSSIQKYRQKLLRQCPKRFGCKSMQLTGKAKKRLVQVKNNHEELKQTYQAGDECQVSRTDISSQDESLSRNMYDQVKSSKRNSPNKPEESGATDYPSPNTPPSNTERHSPINSDETEGDQPIRDTSGSPKSIHNSEDSVDKDHALNSPENTEGPSNVLHENDSKEQSSVHEKATGPLTKTEEQSTENEETIGEPDPLEQPQACDNDLENMTNFPDTSKESQEEVVQDEQDSSKKIICISPLPTGSSDVEKSGGSATETKKVKGQRKVKNTARKTIRCPSAQPNPAPKPKVQRKRWSAKSLNEKRLDSLIKSLKSQLYGVARKRQQQRQRAARSSKTKRKMAKKDEPEDPPEPEAPKTNRTPLKKLKICLPPPGHSESETSSSSPGKSKPDTCCHDDELPDLLPVKRRRQSTSGSPSSLVIPAQEQSFRLSLDLPRHNWLEHKILQRGQNQENVVPAESTESSASSGPLSKNNSTANREMIAKKRKTLEEECSLHQAVASPVHTPFPGKDNVQEAQDKDLVTMQPCNNSNSANVETSLMNPEQPSEEQITAQLTMAGAEEDLSSHFPMHNTSMTLDDITTADDSGLVIDTCGFPDEGPEPQETGGHEANNNELKKKEAGGAASEIPDVPLTQNFEQTNETTKTIKASPSNLPTTQVPRVLKSPVEVQHKDLLIEGGLSEMPSSVQEQPILLVNDGVVQNGNSKQDKQKVARLVPILSNPIDVSEDSDETPINDPPGSTNDGQIEDLKTKYERQVIEYRTLQAMTRLKEKERQLLHNRLKRLQREIVQAKTFFGEIQAVRTSTQQQLGSNRGPGKEPNVIDLTDVDTGDKAVPRKVLRSSTTSTLSKSGMNQQALDLSFRPSETTTSDRPLPAHMRESTVNVLVRHSPPPAHSSKIDYNSYTYMHCKVSDPSVPLQHNRGIISEPPVKEQPPSRIAHCQTDIMGYTPTGKKPFRAEDDKLSSIKPAATLVHRSLSLPEEFSQNIVQMSLKQEPTSPQISHQQRMPQQKMETVIQYPLHTQPHGQSMRIIHEREKQGIPPPHQIQQQNSLDSSSHQIPAMPLKLLNIAIPNSMSQQRFPMSPPMPSQSSPRYQVPVSVSLPPVRARPGRPGRPRLPRNTQQELRPRQITHPYHQQAQRPMPGTLIGPPNVTIRPPPPYPGQESPIRQAIAGEANTYMQPQQRNINLAQPGQDFQQVHIQDPKTIPHQNHALLQHSGQLHRPVMMSPDQGIQPAPIPTQQPTSVIQSPQQLRPRNTVPLRLPSQQSSSDSSGNEVSHHPLLSMNNMVEGQETPIQSKIALEVAHPGPHSNPINIPPQQMAQPTIARNHQPQQLPPEMIPMFGKPRPNIQGQPSAQQAGPMHVPQRPLPRHMLVPVREPHPVTQVLVPQHQPPIRSTGHNMSNFPPDTKVMLTPHEALSHPRQLQQQVSRASIMVNHQAAMTSPQLVTPPGNIDRSLEPLHSALLHEKSNSNQVAAAAVKDGQCGQGVLCAVCGKTAAFLCSGCAKTPYCSGTCQHMVWNSHKHECRASRLSC